MGLLLNLEKEQSSRSSNKKIEFHFLTLFPEVFGGVLSSSLLGKAVEKGLISFNLVQIRDFALDRHRRVDDLPYGGGEGMLLKADVLHAAWQSVMSELQTHPVSPESSSGIGASESNSAPPERSKTLTILLSPQGPRLTQARVRELAAQYSKLVLICGHYEGVDERFIEHCVDEEISIGDYVLTGGELPALVLADAVTRCLPGVIGNPRSLSEESLENGLLKYPQYTRPQEFLGHTVPEVLMTGNHPVIRSWRETQMQERTQKKRPDLWQKYIEVQNKKC